VLKVRLIFFIFSRTKVVSAKVLSSISIAAYMADRDEVLGIALPPSWPPFAALALILKVRLIFFLFSRTKVASAKVRRSRSIVAYVADRDEVLGIALPPSWPPFAALALVLKVRLLFL
jgi:hypothetical protein